MLYIPSSGTATSFGTEVELRRLTDGRIALLAYTALDRLADHCGPYQPWVLIPTDRLDEIERDQNFDVILLDAEIPKEFRRPEGLVSE
ncbi:SAV_915 family protein [Schaalia vaccimaxillae]|uniref:SAV_915 family protein n=1 Tax=Schaalia vaccimaxillae TaxID=183916 RepID=UPI0003B57966|nr:SAV_915 family protein [Schaalia vaccimaxillae]